MLAQPYFLVMVKGKKSMETLLIEGLDHREQLEEV